jgi:hypothetical protein
VTCAWLGAGSSAANSGAVIKSRIFIASSLFRFRSCRYSA